MKRIAAWLCALLMLLNGVAFAESATDLTTTPPSEQEALTAPAQQELSLQEDRMIERAIETLKQAYTTYYTRRANTFEEHSDAPFEGYLEIVDTRVIYIKEQFQLADEKDQKKAEEVLGDVQCLVEFMLYEDMGTAPYYPSTFLYPCVIVYRDGSMEANHSPMYDRLVLRYQVFLAETIQSISDRGSEFNASWYLLK